jgi:thymidylate kinase
MMSFVVLLGPDGAGKSTLVENMKARAPEWVFTSAQPRDLYPIEGLECYDWALQRHPREFVKNMSPLTRATFFMHVLSIELEYHILPALADGRVVVSDSYWYRMMAKESIQNPSGAAVLAGMVDRLPRPDLVIMLDVPLEMAWRRNGEPTTFEVADDDYSWEGFARFQRQVLDELDVLVADLPQMVLDGRAAPGELAQQAVEHIRSHLDASRPVRSPIAVSLSD